MRAKYRLQYFGCENQHICIFSQFILTWYNCISANSVNRASQRIQNITEIETEARREDARQRVSKRVQNETEGETEARREDLRQHREEYKMKLKKKKQGEKVQDKEYHK